MNFISKGLTRKALSLAVLATPLSLLLLSACGGGGGGGGAASAGPSGPSGPAPVSLVNGQAAKVAIGQTSLTGSLCNTSSTSMCGPFGNAGVDASSGWLYVADNSNSRILGFNSIPTTNGASAVLSLGQSTMTTWASGVSAAAMNLPMAPVASGGKLFFADWLNNRVGIYNTMPTTSPGTIDVVVGQLNKTTAASGCSATTLNQPRSVAAAGGKMVVADTGNNRVLIWNAVPTADGTAANLVLGQASMTASAPNAGGAAPTASTLNVPSAVWTDGTRLAVLDTFNNRVLIWKTFPTTNNQPADLVVGQTSFTTANWGTSATLLNNPYAGLFVDAAGQMFVTDTWNHRVLVWNTFPAANGQAADVVLGQPNFTSSASGVSATTLNEPAGVSVFGNQVIVTDYMNSRVLVY